MIDWFSKIIKGKKNEDLVSVEVNDVNIEEKDVSYKDILNFKDVDDSEINVSNISIGNTTNNYYITNNFGDIKDDSQSIEESEIAKTVKQIEKLQEEFKYKSSIKSYNDLLLDYVGKSLNTNDKFHILNGILNCYVNLNDEENINKYINKIEDLSSVDEINKFHFLCAVFYLNQRNLDKSYIEINKAIDHKPDYFKALCLKVLIECEKQIINFDTAVGKLIDCEGKPIIGSGDNKDNSYVFNTLGDISMLSKRYEEAIKYYTKANEIKPSPLEKAHVGISIYFKAVENATNGDFILQKKVNYKELNYAISIFEELYNHEDEEIRHAIRRQISSVYFKCLYLANSVGKINSIFDELKDYCPNEISELYRLKAISEALEGEVSPETLKEVSVEEQNWIHLVQKMEDGKFEKVIDELEPFIWSTHKDNERYHAMLLQSYLKVDKTDQRFINHFKKYRDLGKKSDIIDFIEGLYYEKNHDLSKAEKIIKEIAFSTSDFVMYIELISFYERNKLEDALGNLFEDLFENNPQVIEFSKSKFYHKYFLHLFRTKNVPKAIKVHSSLNPGDLDEETYIRITAEIMYLIGNFKKSAIEFENLYVRTKKLEDLFNSLVSYLNYNNIEKSEEIVTLLIYKDYKRKSTLYAVYSNIEILKNDIDKAYEYAKTAKDFDRENPYSDVHPFYFGRSIRCNKEEGTAYVCEFACNYPRHNKWLKGFKAIEKDESGNDIPSKEFTDFLNSQSKRFSEIRGNYSNRKIGISAVAKAYHQTIPEILNWRHYYNIKASITSGMIQEVSSEIVNSIDEVVIDALGLYILAEIKYLDILKHFKRVYITYSTIESLQLTIMSIEDPKVREIFNFINGSLNIEVVSPDFISVSQLNNNLSNVFFKDQLDSAVYSHTNHIIYIYSDYFFKAIMEGYNNNFISFVAFFRVLLGQGVINKETLSDVVLLLKKNKYDFINFDSDDLYNIAKKSDFEMVEDIKLFFELDKHCDLSSFVSVYINFFKSINNIIERKKFDKYVDVFIELFDKYTRKTQYHFHILEMLNPDYKDEIKYLQEKCSLTSLTLYQDLDSVITNTYEFHRIKHIMAICEGALRLFLNIFKDNQEDYDYYSKQLREKCRYIAKSDIDFIILNAKKSFLPIDNSNNS